MTLSRRLVHADDLAAWPTPLDLASLVRWVELDVAALRHNVDSICRLVGPGVAVMAMVKANGYGHGAVLTARAAIEGGATWIGVSSADEALQLRAAGITAPVLIVGWTPDAALPPLLEADVDLAVFTVAAVEAVAAAAVKPAGIHLKLDTGMGRLGARGEDLDAVVAALQRHAAKVRVKGIFTHFASSEDDADFTALQNRRFEESLATLRHAFPDALAHAANSGALLGHPETRHEMVRPGIAMYGYPPHPFNHVAALQPALSMLARVTHLKTVQRGDSVGYGRAWVAEQATKVATVAAGYADGISRRQGNSGGVMLQGRRCPIIGRVSMDQITVDVSELDNVGVGEAALIVGRYGDSLLSAEDVAAAAGTISYEVLCSISARVPRLILEA